MHTVASAYASPSTLHSNHEHVELALCANLHRPLAFHGEVVQHGAIVRLALQTLGEAMWSPRHRLAHVQALDRVLDPLMTVHPDRLGLEAFTQDRGAYVSLQIDAAVFRPLGPPLCGSSPVDFSIWLWEALGEVRTSRRLQLRVSTREPDLATRATCALPVEQKLALPDAWVHDFLHLQSALARPGTHLTLRPADLLATLRFLALNPARVRPSALRYEMRPDQPATLVIEPFEHRVPLPGAVHDHRTQHCIRTWGRDKLGLIKPLLPFAHTVDVRLQGVTGPCFYTVHLPGMSVVLGLPAARPDDPIDRDPQPRDPAAGLPLQQRVLALLTETCHASAPSLAFALQASEAATTAALGALARAGRVTMDLRLNHWRHRELFSPPWDTVTPADPCRDAVERLLTEPKALQIQHVSVEEEPLRTRRFLDPHTGDRIERARVYRHWRIWGCSEGFDTEIVVNDDEQLTSGTCGCAFFDTYLLDRGPCPHMQALRWHSQSQRHGCASADPDRRDQEPAA